MSLKKINLKKVGKTDVFINNIKGMDESVCIHKNH